MQKAGTGSILQGMGIGSSLLFCCALLAGSGRLCAEEPRALSLPKFDEELKPCIPKAESGVEDPATLQALMDCQFNLRLQWVRLYNQGKGAAPSNEVLDSLDESQRAEVRGYLARHPDRAHADQDVSKDGSGKSAGSDSAGGSAGAAPEGASAAGRCRLAQKKSARPARAGDEASRAQQARTGQAMDQNLRDSDATTKIELEDLNDYLVASSDNGKLGVTQDGAMRIVEFLECQQGSASNDMIALLNHVVRDGPKLQNDTLRLLKRAVRDGKSQGLKLGVEPTLEKWLLDPRTDPADDPNGPNPTSGSNSN